MKNCLQIALLFLLISPFATAQAIYQNSTDPKTGARSILTSNHKGKDIAMSDNISKKGMLFFSAGYHSVPKSGELTETYFIDLNMIHNDNRLGCLKHQTGKAILTFEDDTQMECFQVSETNCDKLGFVGGYALMPRGGDKTTMKPNFDKLLTTNIIKIEVFTTESSLVYKIKTDAMAYIKSHFKLLDTIIRQGKRSEAVSAN